VTTLAKSPASPQPPATPPVPQHDPRYTIGTLTYTKRSLIAMFVWMLCGNVAFTLMEAVFPVSMPLQLQRLGVPDAWMPVLMITFAQIMNMFLSPVISFRSDRTRSRWGRRIPYIVLTLPFLCLCLVALGFTDEIGLFIRHSWMARLGSPLTAVILVVEAQAVEHLARRLLDLHPAHFPHLCPRRLRTRTSPPRKRTAPPSRAGRLNRARLRPTMNALNPSKRRARAWSNWPR
jgi:hypothetical protein